MDYYASKGENRLLSDEQIHQFITSTVLPHHRSLTRNESRVNECYPEPDVVTNAYKKPEVVNQTLPVMRGTYIEVEPSRKQYLPHTVQTVLQNPSTRTVEKMALRWANHLLSDEQIHHFIQSTVLPHHRRLTNPDKSHNRPKSSGENLNRQWAVVQGNPQTDSVHQETPRASTKVLQTVPAHQSALQFSSVHQESQKEAMTVPKEIRIPETNNVKPEMQAGTTRFSQEGSEIMDIPRGIQGESSKEAGLPELISVLDGISGKTTWNSPETTNVPYKNHGEVTDVSLKDCEVPKTHYEVSVQSRVEQKEGSLSQIQCQNTREQATGIIQQTQLTQKQTKRTVMKNKAKQYYKYKTFANGRKKGKKIRCQATVRKRQKIVHGCIRKSLHRVTKSGEKTEPDKEVPSKNDGKNEEVVDKDVEKFLKKFSLDKLNVSRREPARPADSSVPVDISPWDPEYTLVSEDQHSRQELLDSGRFIPCQDCYIDLDLFL